MTAIAERPRILFITKFIPDGPSSGGLVRTEAILRILRRRFDVSVVGYRERGGRRPPRRLAAVVNSLATNRAYQVARWDSRWIRRWIADEVERFRPHAIHVDHTPIAPLAGRWPLPRVLDMHNIESRFAASIADSTRGAAAMLARRDARMLRSLEARAAEDFRLVIVSSRSEAERAPCPVEIVPNGVYGTRVPLDVAPDRGLLSFVGVFSWLPNIDGAEWLVHRVLPHLPADLRLRLVGRDPHARVLALAGPRVEVTGEVEDPWTRVCESAVVLAPNLSKGGTRLKILEGLLAERPVVATPQAADGLEDLEGEGVVLADTPERFAAEAAALARDPDRAAALGRAGRRALLERYDWEAIGDRLLELYETRLGLS